MKAKKIKVTILAMLCMLMSTVSVGAVNRPEFDFMLMNSGQNYNQYSGRNSKTYAGSPWTLKVKWLGIDSSDIGTHGVRFASMIASTNQVCSQSGIWRTSTGYAKVAWSSGQGKVGEYYIAARMDDDFYSTYSTGGWWNSDSVSDN